MGESTKEGRRTKADVIKEALDGTSTLASNVKEKTFLLTHLPETGPENIRTDEPSNFTEEVLRTINRIQEDLEQALKVLEEFI